MIEVRNYSRIEDDTEVVALMPSVDTAVEWIRAQMDLGLLLEGDYYCVDEKGLRTYLTSEGPVGRYFITVEEVLLIGRLVQAVLSRRAPATADAVAASLKEKFGWGTNEARP